jgi:hypothetical protein
MYWWIGLTTMTTYTQKITFDEMRASGVRDVLIYCRDHRCGHRITISANRWAGLRLLRLRQARRRHSGRSFRGGKPMKITKEDLDALARLTEAFPQTFV